MSTLFGTSATTSSTQGDLSKDVAVKELPEDSVSEIVFSPKSDHLAVSSWDNKVRIYEIDNSGNSQGKALFSFDGPALGVCWSDDGTKVFGGAADKTARMLDLNSGNSQATQVALHEQPVRCVRTFNHNGNTMLVTGSWDKTVKYWDLRSSQPAASINCQDRVYAMDVKNQLLVVATAERYLNIINLADPGKFYRTLTSPLKWQTRVVSCFPDAAGFAIGSIEGRCAMQYVEESNSTQNFSFKCHRQPDPNDRNASKVYAVHDISWHPVHGTFSTAGSDGTYHFWDKDAKHRLKGYPEVGGPIVSTSFNHDGRIFAYAVSYDWSKGFTGHTQNSPMKIMLHPVTPDECKPRQPARKK